MMVPTSHNPTCAAPARRIAGVSALEMMVALAMVGVMAALAVPGFLQWRQDAQTRDAGRQIADAFMIARSEAIRTGNRHIVVFGNGTGLGPGGLNPLTNWVPGVPSVLVYNDGPTAAANCIVDLNETIYWVPVNPNLNWGGLVSGGAVAAPNDGNPFPPPPINVGTSFTDQNANSINWVMFRPDGIPVAFDGPLCNLGATGTGGGGVYFTDNARRDYAVVLTPLGGVRVHSWDAGTGAWRN